MIKKIIILLLVILIILIIINNKETFQNNNKQTLYDNLMNNHWKKIFPDNANRNSGGFRFFKYIYDNLAKDETLFDEYNKFYCAVSGSVVSPSDYNYNILKVKDKDNKCVFGKYYRCCTPCNCDIMKYAQVETCQIEIPKNSGKFFTKKLLTIGDPCSDQSKFPPEVDKTVFECKNNLLTKGYHLYKNKLTEDKGRLVIGVLYDCTEDEKKKVSETINMCTTGTKRLLSSVENLKYGMGDIFVKLALINNNNNYKHSLEDLCKN